MNQSPESLPGVGEVQAEEPHRTEFLDFIAIEGLRLAYVAAAELRAAAGSHPTEFIGAAQYAQQLQKLIAYMELGLREAGYTENEVNRIPKSTIDQPPNDPSKPRTNL